jgi:hypothetical protein
VHVSCALFANWQSYARGLGGDGMKEAVALTDCSRMSPTVHRCDLAGAGDWTMLLVVVVGQIDNLPCGTFVVGRV